MKIRDRNKKALLRPLLHLSVEVRSERHVPFLSPLPGLAPSFCLTPQLALWAAFFRRFAAAISAVFDSGIFAQHRKNRFRLSRFARALE